MSDTLIIGLIALGVFIVGCLCAFVCVLMDGRRMRRKMRQRRVEDAEREEMFGIHAVKRSGDFSVYEPGKKDPVGFIRGQSDDADDDSTKTLPVIDWERRYAELVEVVAARTDQAKAAK